MLLILFSVFFYLEKYLKNNICNAAHLVLIMEEVQNLMSM